MHSERKSYIDYPLLTVIMMLCGISLIVLYSATGENMDQLTKHGIRAGFAFALMIVFSRIPPAMLARWSMHLYFSGLGLLFIVLAVGIIGKGAQRWIDLGLFRFQPAEIMKIGVPMMVAWVLTRSPLPPRPIFLVLAIFVVLIPTTLVILQPDLGTALLIALTGIVVIFLAGVSWKLITAVAILMSSAAPIMWAFVLHDYQRRRVLTLFDPWSDPLGAGYHTIQCLLLPLDREESGGKAGCPELSLNSSLFQKEAPILFLQFLQKNSV